MEWIIHNHHKNNRIFLKSLMCILFHHIKWNYTMILLMENFRNGFRSLAFKNATKLEEWRDAF